MGMRLIVYLRIKDWIFVRLAKYGELEVTGGRWLMSVIWVSCVKMCSMSVSNVSSLRCWVFELFFLLKEERNKFEWSKFVK